ncbi:MAG: helix-turn-helix transcriptional regulator [Lachnospiraceae bacterium]|nr:helix-turn-helix transcriptional regulator [Lachnospiraceae bacterium]
MNEYWQKLEHRKLYFLTDAFRCSYFSFRLPDSDEFIACGPFTFEIMQGARLDDFLENEKIPPKLHEQLRQYYQGIAFVTSPVFFTNLFRLLAENLFGKDGYEMIESDFGDLKHWSDFYQGYYRIEDKPFLGNQIVEARYQIQADMLMAVQNGNGTKALELLSSCFSYFIPTSTDNPLREEKYYCATLNTMLRKPAETAGVHPVHIDSLSNKNIRTIDKLTSVEQCRNFCRDCVQSYCRLIRRYTLGNYSQLTQKVITYTSTDLTADLSLKAFSDLFSVNASYLSSLFKKEVGIPLTEYVNRARIQYAQRLLASTDLPIKAIASQCGIPDIYYFSRLFKRITGATPTGYRENNLKNKVFRQIPPQR